MAPKILLTDNPLSAMDIARELAPSGFDVVIARSGTPEFTAALSDAEYIVGLGEVKMDDEFYKSAPKLRLVQLLSAGYDRVDIEAARRARVPVCNNGGANAIAVSEHAILLMLAVCRRLTWLHSMVASGRWRGNDVASVRLYELHGRTLGIVGLGNIGKKVVRLAKGFGMAIQYFDVARLSEDDADAHRNGGAGEHGRHHQAGANQRHADRTAAEALCARASRRPANVRGTGLRVFHGNAIRLRRLDRQFGHLAAQFCVLLVQLSTQPCQFVHLGRQGVNCPSVIHRDLTPLRSAVCSVGTDGISEGRQDSV